VRSRHPLYQNRSLNNEPHLPAIWGEFDETNLCELVIMAAHFMQQMLTPDVLTAQQHYYGRQQRISAAGEQDVLTDDEIAFIHSRDSFYMSTVNADGWPYIQHRGGEKGFLRVIGPNELVFADFGGNRQMLSVGHLTANDRVCLFLMDYVHRERLKLLGHATVQDAREPAAAALAAQLVPAAKLAKVERLFRIRITGYDWNCPQHITQRFSVDEVQAAVAPLHARIAELEAQIEGEN
jgi:uncharacterized protein